MAERVRATILKWRAKHSVWIDRAPGRASVSDGSILQRYSGFDSPDITRFLDGDPPGRSDLRRSGDAVRPSASYPEARTSYRSGDT